MIDFQYVDFNKLLAGDFPDLTPRVALDLEQELDINMGLERMFHNMTQEQLEVVICLFLGIPAEEAAIILGYPNVDYFYNRTVLLYKYYRQQKNHYLMYN